MWLSIFESIAKFILFKNFFFATSLVCSILSFKSISFFVETKLLSWFCSVCSCKCLFFNLFFSNFCFKSSSSFKFSLSFIVIIIFKLNFYFTLFNSFLCLLFCRFSIAFLNSFLVGLT